MLESEQNAGQNRSAADNTADTGSAEQQHSTSPEKPATSSQTPTAAGDTTTAESKSPPRRRAASRPAGPPTGQDTAGEKYGPVVTGDRAADPAATEETTEQPATKKTTAKKATTKKATAKSTTAQKATSKKTTAKKATAEKATAKKTSAKKPATKEATTQQRTDSPAAEETIPDSGTTGADQATSEGETQQAASKHAVAQRATPEAGTAEAAETRKSATKRATANKKGAVKKTGSPTTSEQADTSGATAESVATEPGTTGSSDDLGTGNAPGTAGTAADAAAEDTVSSALTSRTAGHTAESKASGGQRSGGRKTSTKSGSGRQRPVKQTHSGGTVDAAEDTAAIPDAPESRTTGRGGESSSEPAPATDPAIEAALETAWKQLRTDQATQQQAQDQASGADVPERRQDNSRADTPGVADDVAEVATTKQGQEHDDTGDQEVSDEQESGANGRRRRRGGRRRRRSSQDRTSESEQDESSSTSDGTGHADSGKTAKQSPDADQGDQAERSDGRAANHSDESGNGRRRRRRRRRGEESGGSDDDPNDVVVKVRDRRGNEKSDEVSGIDGSTRVEAKRVRRRESRESSRRRSPILSEEEFLARRESVNRKMIIRQLEEIAQIAVLEDGILVEHYVDRVNSSSLIGNVYLGRVQNVLPSMEAAFVDIGRGRNAVLYAGDLDWDGLGAEGEGERKIEKVLKSGQSVLVQVTKDPLGAKGARLTHHISMPGRYVVYAPGGHVSGISRKLPEEERKRLKSILAEPVGDTASVIIRTAAEGASAEELTRDVNRLQAQWQDIEKKVKAGNAPQLLYAEPDLTLRIVRDLFTEDFAELIVQGDGSMTDAFDSVDGYVRHVAPHLVDRLHRWDPESSGDLFSSYRLDEQISKGLERKVFLPSGGSLIIDRTEAMTVIDVNTGKFTGNGGNLEATVASNNLEAAEEIVRQLRLRDIGGIIVIDFIDMVLPDNRELVLRRLVECLGRDRTRHQVSEVTSLGLVQMTRKRIGSGLLEAFSTECPQCDGRGVELHEMPVADKKLADGGARDDQGGRGRGNRRRNRGGGPKKDAAEQGSSTDGKSGKEQSNNTGKDNTGEGTTGQDNTGQDNTGQDKSGKENTGKASGGKKTAGKRSTGKASAGKSSGDKNSADAGPGDTRSTDGDPDRKKSGNDESSVREHAEAAGVS